MTQTNGPLRGTLFLVLRASCFLRRQVNFRHSCFVLIPIVCEISTASIRAVWGDLLPMSSRANETLRPISQARLARHGPVRP